MRSLSFQCLFTAFAFLAVTPVPVLGAMFGLGGSDAAARRTAIEKQRDGMLAQLYKAKPEMREKLRNAAGYATFRQMDVNLFLVASGNGSGVLHDNRTGRDVFMRMASLGGGVGLGLKDLSVIFVFHDPELMRAFVEDGWQVGGKADASAKYNDTGVSAEQNVKANVSFRDGTVAAAASSDARLGDGLSAMQAGAGLGEGIEVFQFTDSGISLQATLSGTKYWKDSKLNR